MVVWPCCATVVAPLSLDEMEGDLGIRRFLAFFFLFFFDCDRLEILAETAACYKSFASQQLEWLSDALLEWLVSEELSVLFPQANQGNPDVSDSVVGLRDEYVYATSTTLTALHPSPSNCARWSPRTNRTLSHLAWQYGFDDKIRHNIHQSPAIISAEKSAVREQKLFANAFEAYLAGVAQLPHSHERINLVRDYLHRLLALSCAADLWTKPCLYLASQLFLQLLLRELPCNPKLSRESRLTAVNLHGLPN